MRHHRPPTVANPLGVSRPVRSVALVTAMLLLLVAWPELASASTADSCPDGDVPEDGFVDVPVTNVHEYNVDCLAWWDITAGTSEESYSPEASVTRAQMASFLVRTYERVTGERVSPTKDYFVDDDGSIHENDIRKLAELGITAGCNPDDGNTHYCPHDPVTRAQMGSFLVRTYQEITGKAVDGSNDTFTDDDGNVHETDINRLAELGITAGCNPAGGNTRYCPDDPVTRAEMATFLMRELDVLVQLGEVKPPPASEKGQTDNDGDPCDISDCSTPTIQTIDLQDNDGNGNVSTHDVWTFTFSTSMDTSRGVELRHQTHDGQFEYLVDLTCESDWYDCTWVDDQNLRIVFEEEQLQDTDWDYPATIIEFNVRTPDGTPVDLERSADVTVN